MACSACARRRKAIEAKRKQKKAQGKPVQAVALGAVLVVSEAAGKVIGIHGEVEDASGNEEHSAPTGSSADVIRGHGAEPDR